MRAMRDAVTGCYDVAVGTCRLGRHRASGKRREAANRSPKRDTASPVCSGYGPQRGSAALLRSCACVPCAGGLYCACVRCAPAPLRACALNGRVPPGFETGGATAGPPLQTSAISDPNLLGRTPHAVREARVRPHAPGHRRLCLLAGLGPDGLASQEIISQITRPTSGIPI